MADKLGVFNGALIHCEERTLGSLTEGRESRRLLDAVFDGGAIRRVLAKGHWNFAARSTKIEYDPSLDPDFGFQRAFLKPSDWVRTTTVATDEYFNRPLTNRSFADEAGYLFADVDTLYVKFVSDGADYGGTLANWSEPFTELFELYLASRVVKRLTKDKGIQDRIEAALERAVKGATAKDAQDSGTSTQPVGSWNRARSGGRFGAGRRDGGSRGALIG